MARRKNIVQRHLDLCDFKETRLLYTAANCTFFDTTQNRVRTIVFTLCEISGNS